MTKTPALSELLKGQQFCLLTTYRKDGTPVPTAMWFALEGETLYLYTKGGSAKIKRLRHQPMVKIGPCNGSGVPLGKQVEAVARLVDAETEVELAEQRLAERYGLKRRLLLWGLSFSKDKSKAMIAVQT